MLQECEQIVQQTRGAQGCSQGVRPALFCDGCKPKRQRKCCRQVARSGQQPRRAHGHRIINDKVGHIGRAQLFLRGNENRNGAKQIDKIRQPQPIESGGAVPERGQRIDRLVFCRAEEPAQALAPVLLLVLQEAEPVAGQLIVDEQIQCKPHRDQQERQALACRCKHKSAAGIPRPVLPNDVCHQLEADRREQQHARHAREGCKEAQNARKDVLLPACQIHAGDREKQEQAVAHGRAEQAGGGENAQVLDCAERAAPVGVEQREFIEQVAGEQEHHVRYEHAGYQVVLEDIAAYAHYKRIEREEDQQQTCVALGLVAVFGNAQVVACVRAERVPDVHAVEDPAGIALLHHGDSIGNAEDQQP